MGRMLEWLTEHGKPLRVKVTTMDADLNELSLERDSVGQHLFDTVCKIIGLREIWYFGLCFTNRKGFTCWLQMDKRIRDQNVPKQPDGSLHFLFLVKFFPESVKGELIQDLTRHLFFLQIRQSILTMDLYCPSEAAILLASYAVQALYGDQAQHHQQQQQAEQLDLAKLLPVSVLQQYELTADMWEEKIRSWWANNSGLSKEEAEEEFLCVAEELDMYGTQYYPIRNQKDAELLLGVSALGVGIFETDNKLSPRPFFPWTEIKCISFKHKMFTIYTADKSKIKFRAQDMSINQSLLDLCVGTHNLYLRRRQPDLLEVQQMKLQADEQRRRRMIRDQSVPKQPDGSLHFLFLVKFFPESVKGELIQDLTRHLFFLQIRQSILTMDLYCPSEAAILLASYAVQALYGDQAQHQQQQQQAEQLDLAKLLPVSVLQQYELTADMWEEKIRSWWANNSGLSKEEAEEEFLCVAEELDMYGTQYYPIRNQKDAELLLGVSALGVGIFETDNKLSPRPFLPLDRDQMHSFKHKMFTISL
uniref:Moesin/ezrin/radixin homolog 1 n=1 Tax=Globodera pallida TaxID=36090 RepID=A0A183C6L0_GLOPA